MLTDFERAIQELSARGQIERALRKRNALRLPPWERREDLYGRLREQRNAAVISREVLTADGMAVAAFCGGFSQFGWGLTGTWTGTAFFEAATQDNPNQWFADSQTPFPSGTNVSSATANGNFFSAVKPNIFLKRVRFSRTTGSVIVTGAAAVDSSWQDAFLTASTVFNSSRKDGGGTNTLTQAAQANRAWNLTFLEVCLNGPQFQGQVNLTVYDGTVAGTVLFQEFVPTTGGSIGYTYKANLPTDALGNPTLVNTPGNAMTITVAGFGGSCVINTKFSAG